MVQLASMTKSKKYFLIGAIIFFIIIILVMIDISKRTVAPWEKNSTEQSDGEG